MENLKDETLSEILRVGKTVGDVLWVGDGKRYMTFAEFLLVSDKQYDAGFGGTEVLQSLKVVFVDSWLERFEYDGSEYWVYKKYPTQPEQHEVFSPFGEDF